MNLYGRIEIAGKLRFPLPILSVYLKCQNRRCGSRRQRRVKFPSVIQSDHRIRHGENTAGNAALLPADNQEQRTGEVCIINGNGTELEGEGARASSVNRIPIR